MQLGDLPHSSEAIDVLRDFAKHLGKTKKLLSLFSREGVVLTEPIDFEAALADGRCESDDHFEFLQGDIVSTDSAYYIGQRVINNPIFILANSTCDLVKDRRDGLILYRVTPVIVKTEAHQKQATEDLSSMLKFNSTRHLYIPRFEWQSEEVHHNIVDFTKPHTIHSRDLRNAHRIYSLTTLYWRIFSSILRFISSRTNPSEKKLRNTHASLSVRKSA